MSLPLLYALPYSPWSQKAQWALDHHRIEYRRRGYLPMIGAPLLRLKTGRWRGRLTVPCWIADGDVLMDSMAIAQAADRLGRAAPLFPRQHLEAIEAWNARSEAALAAGRALTTHAVGADAVALRESVPQPFQAMPGVGPLFGRLGVRFLTQKYALDAHTLEQHAATLVEALEATRAALGEADGGRYLVGAAFTYADVAVAMALQFVSPTAWHPVGPASRPHWTRPSLAARFPGVLAWRDAVIAKHHPKYGSPPPD